MNARRAFLRGAVASVVTSGLSAEAQQAERRIALVVLTSLPVHKAAFERKLNDLGWPIGQRLAIDRHRLNAARSISELAVEVVRQAPDVIVVPSAGIATAIRQQTTSIPIVVIAAGDLVSTGLADSLARPGGNVTGTQIAQRDLFAKRLQLLREILPRLTRVAALQESTTIPAAMRSDTRRTFEHAARAATVTPLWFELPTIRDIDERLRTMVADRAHALLVVGSPFILEHAVVVAETVARHRMPTSFDAKEFVEAGGVMSYGVDFVPLFERAAAFVDKILRGASPASLPIEEPTKFELAINIKAARSLSLTIPRSLLLQADQMIE